MTHSDSTTVETTRDIASPAAELVGVAKRFGHVVAVSTMNLTLRAGEVVGLVGENGAGKSTCVKMLAGVHGPSSGEIRVHGRPVELSSPSEARRHGIAVVHQHPGLFPDLPVYENVFAENRLTDSWGRLDRGTMRQRSGELLRSLGLQVDPRLRTGELSTSEQQLVEIAKALASDASVLVLDEPTASLTVGETRRLFEVIDGLRHRGVAMMFVGHRLEEILQVCDTVTVMRDGAWVADLTSAATDEHELVRLMVGRELGDLYPPRRPPTDDVVLSVEGLTVPGQFDDVSFQVRAGEIVGLAGLVGAGRTEVARALFGIERPSAGTVVLGGERVTVRSPSDALAHGIAYVSEDRRGQSIIEDFSILDNAVLPMVGNATRLGLVRRRLEFALVSDSLQRMRLKYDNLGQPIRQLSGGNQQKVVLAKWLATGPRLLILDEPTQGVDVQAKAEVHRIIAGLAAQGLAVLLISSDMPELLGMCDRIAVMHAGRVTAQFDAGEVDQVDIGLAATGVLSSPPHAADDVAPPTGECEREQLRAEAEQQPVTVVSEPRRHRWRDLLQRRETGLVGAIVLVLIPLIAVNPAIASGANLRDLSSSLALYGIVALGQMFVMLTRNIDLSVGSTIGLSAYVCADFMAGHHGAPVVVGIAIAAAVGLLAGLVNGVVVAWAKVPSIVVTLGTLAIYRGIDATLSNGRQISSGSVAPEWLAWTNGTWLGVPKVAVYGLLAVAIVGYVLWLTGFGRDVYATGSNPEGAELIGIRTRRAVVAAFAVSGVLAGTAGAMWASYYATVDGQLAFGTELTIIASVVVGGVSLRGGVGTVTGVVLGTLALVVIQNAITVARIDPMYLQAFFGAAILLTVAVDVALSGRTRHSLRRSQ
ncbi:ATP-binding cassette domain-containing protein [Pseudonocardia oroxyli]|uniref:Rhamnose transport system ATP-binding protein n=1 Tax=Pseudonocardia oroxyli TaxID=366584 RepID=A0A1G7STH4_PSEOR|nr:ATP-binding cassette domain-containing protein [Pseudonocardia oroxyli]SDG26426.1 rhamnose transport system ATP-binding protein [Pseudonocardia oroxyli]